MRRIFLIGYMGAGKTTMGKQLSQESGLSFVDLDLFIERRYCKTIQQLFDEKGENSFREIEKKALHEVADFEDIVISTGGGTPCFFDNMAHMNSLGTTIYLKVSPEGLAERIKLCQKTRPILKDLSGDELKRFIETSLTERIPFYEQAKIIFDAEVMVSRKDIMVLTSNLQKTIMNSYA